MKVWRKVTSGMLVMALLVGLLAVPQPVRAASQEAKVSHKAVHMYPGAIEEVNIMFANYGDYVTNLKTSSKNAVAKVTRISQTENGDCTANLGIYVAKVGDYKVTFDVKNKDDNVVSSHTIDIIVNKDEAVKKVNFAGKNILTGNKVTKTKGKLAVTLNKGYKLKDITVVTYKKDGEPIQKVVKNNSTITLSKQAWEDEYEGYGSYHFNTNLMIDTVIVIRYTDKYTKEVQSSVCSIWYI